jgi:hypothetical protein
MPQKKARNPIGARVIALAKFDEGVLHEEITVKIGVSRSGLYKLGLRLFHMAGSEEN